MRELWWYTRLWLWLRIYRYRMSLADFSEYLEDGYSPREAVRQDMSYL